MSDQMEKNIIKILKNQEEQNKFNKNVLEKLDNLEKNQQVTNERLDKMESNQQSMSNRLDRMENNQQSMNNRLDRMENNQQSMSNRLDRIESNQSNFQSELQIYKDNQSEINSLLNNLSFEMKETQKVVEFNTSRIINLETKLTDQIKALFDARSVNDGKHYTYEDHITTLNSKIFNLDVRTSALEDYVKTLKEA